MQAGSTRQHVPFTGAGPALTAVLGGQLEMASVALPAAVEMVRQGALRGLAVTSARRSPSLPEVPTAAEAGFPEVDDTTWVALLFPAGTPRRCWRRPTPIPGTPSPKRGRAATPRRDRLRPGGLDLDASAGFVRRETERWGAVVRRLGIALD